MKPRHPEHDRIVEDLLAGLLPKVIAFNRKVSESTVKFIKKTAIETLRVRKFDPGEGQLNFFDVWKNLR